MQHHCRVGGLSNSPIMSGCRGSPGATNSKPASRRPWSECPRSPLRSSRRVASRSIGNFCAMRLLRASSAKRNSLQKRIFGDTKSFSSGAPDRPTSALAGTTADNSAPSAHRIAAHCIAMRPSLLVPRAASLYLELECRFRSRSTHAGTDKRMVLVE
jgi:hypothetical protein